MVRSVDSLKAFMARGGRDDSHRLLPHVIVIGAGKGGGGTSALAGLVAVHAEQRGTTVEIRHPGFRDRAGPAPRSSSA